MNCILCSNAQLYETLPERANLLQFCQDKLTSCYNYLEDIEFGQLEFPSTILSYYVSFYLRPSIPENYI